MDDQIQTSIPEAPQETQQGSIGSLISGLSDEERQQLAGLLNQHPDTNVSADDHGALADAFQQHAQAAASGQASPLQDLLGGGLLNSPLAKLAETAIAGLVGTQFLRR